MRWMNLAENRRRKLKAAAAGLSHANAFLCLIRSLAALDGWYSRLPARFQNRKCDSTSFIEECQNRSRSKACFERGAGTQNLWFIGNLAWSEQVTGRIESTAVHPEGMSDSSRWSQRSGDHRNGAKRKIASWRDVRDEGMFSADHRGVLASLRDAPLRFELSGGLRCAATPGYFLTSHSG